MRLTPLARWECLTILAAGLLLTAAAAAVRLWWLVPLTVIAALAVLAFFRDPNRRPPAQRHAWVAVADGKVTSIHDVEHCEPLGEPAVCVRVFISLLNVHVVRSPCHARLREVVDTPGSFRNAMKAEHLEDNTRATLTLEHPVREEAIAAVRLIAGAVARTIHVASKTGATLQRGERMGIIKLGSTAELYVPKSANPTVTVQVGEKVRAGTSILLRLERRQGAATVLPRTDGSPEPSGADRDEAASPEPPPVSEPADPAPQSRS